MNSLRKLGAPPIVEAVLDFDCDMPLNLDLMALGTAVQAEFVGSYPKLRILNLQQHQLEMKIEGAPAFTTQQAIQAIQLLSADERQLLQVRTHGYSFNRLAPYSSLDDYLPKIHLTWGKFIALVSPIQVRIVRLRYINKILIPMADGQVELDQYFKVGPGLPDEDQLTLTNFINQHSVVERGTGNQANIVLADQPVENDQLPVIFDITTSRVGNFDPHDWDALSKVIQSLRNLKNTIFENTLTPTCLNLFQPLGSS
jgi:uncharacterized protein (TIGR04255 family)